MPINNTKSYLIIGGDQETRLEKATEISENKLNTNNLDVLILTPDKSIGIEEIRTLQKNLSLRPFSSKKKTALIKDAHLLTAEAQNALLKTLEEPPEHSLIILTAPDSFWLLPTVVSRCQVITLPTKIPQIKVAETQTFKNLYEKLLSATVPQRFSLLESISTPHINYCDA